ncbi:MAG: OmpA/MotB family protein [Limisphaerales bacterium]
MSRLVWVIAGYLTLVAGLLLVAFDWHRRGLEVQQLRQQFGEVRGNLFQQTVDRDGMADELRVARERIEVLEHQTEAVTQARQSIEDELRRALESKEVTISELQGRLTVDILDRILFDSGEARLKPEGELVLRKLAGVLEQFPNRQIHVIGHTDNVPIGANFRARYPSNWELSAARSTAAVRFLCEQAGIDPHRVGAVGYGEFRPLADNSTAEGRATNRRIAVVVLSEDLVGSDALPSGSIPRVERAPLPLSTNASTQLSTNSLSITKIDPAVDTVTNSPPENALTNPPVPAP